MATGSMAERRQTPLRALRAVSGVVAAGLVVLAAVTAVAAWLTDRDGAPGPGTDSALGHLTIALVAVVAQVVADRSARPLRTLIAAVVVLVLAATTLWVWWWN